ncbi:Tup N-terminal-domain-containing protein [Mycena leptocephala]|nr:Tup N-terminal-domain-containing protein [Mycena leptocephala]
MSGSTIYNHRSLQPTALAHGHSYVANTLDAIKQEYNLVTNKLYQARILRDEYESKVDTPINELNIIRQTVDELEAQHGKVRQRYEDLLRAELHQLPGPGIHVHSLEGFRERERLGERSGERDQEREPRERNGERDPKRLKINVPGLLRKLLKWLKISGPYHFSPLLPPVQGAGMQNGHRLPPGAVDSPHPRSDVQPMVQTAFNNNQIGNVNAPVNSHNSYYVVHNSRPPCDDDGFRVYYMSDFNDGRVRTVRGMSDVYSGEADGKKLILRKVPDIYAELKKYKENWPNPNLAFAFGYVKGANFIVLHAGSSKITEVRGRKLWAMVFFQIMQMKDALLELGCHAQKHGWQWKTFFNMPFWEEDGRLILDIPLLEAKGMVTRGKVDHDPKFQVLLRSMDGVNLESLRLDKGIRIMAKNCFIKYWVVSGTGF